MSLTQRTTSEVVKQQFLFKLTSNAALFTGLFVTQAVIWGLMSGGASISTGFNMSLFELTWNTFTNDGVVIVSLFWALIVGLIMTTPGQRNAAYMYVSSPAAENWANICFFGVASIIGGVTTVLSGSVMKVVMFLKDGTGIIETAGLVAAPIDFFFRITVMCSYAFLMMLVVYTVMRFVQMNRLMIVPIIVFLLFSTKWSVFGVLGIQGDPISFFYHETSFWLFLVKVVGVIVVLGGLSFIPSGRIEVRQS